jgi:hypothetical protein
MSKSQKKLFAASYVLAAVMMLLFSANSGLAQPQKKAPGNLDAGMSELVQLNNEAALKGRPAPDFAAIEQALRRSAIVKASGVFRLHVDRQNRVLVNILSDGAVDLNTLKQTLVAQGASVVAVNPDYRNGIISAFMPVPSVEAVASQPGIRAISIAHRGRTNAGSTVSQGAILMRSMASNAAGFDGIGITVGVLSDSFNTSSGFGVLDTALTDVSTGDLPNTTTIHGGEGLKFLVELDPDIFGASTDEGRAMAQIVHDVAPGASLCFATAAKGEVDFANNIRALRTNPLCHADVLVDDFTYEDEPFFSDGIVAQAVDEATTSNSLPGHRVAYFSAAGNQAGQGYFSALRIVPDAAVRSLPPGSLRVNLNTVPGNIDTTGGFHNFDPNGGLSIAQDFFFTDFTDFSFQWDDLFDTPGAITTDLNLLFFDPATGAFLYAVNDDNFQTLRPIENFALLTGNGPGTFAEVLMAVARTGNGSHLAKWIKYVAFGGIFDVSGFNTADTPVLFGHSAARSANAVAAVSYTTDPVVFGPTGFKPMIESFSSPGPATIAFDDAGKRLKTPEVREKPDIAAPDGVNTTFFPEAEIFGALGLDFEGDFGLPDGFPNFFGTSAAAPHAAGTAALLLQKAGGPGSISPQLLGKKLKKSARVRDVDFFWSAGTGKLGSSRITVAASGDQSSLFSRNFFQISFDSSDQNQVLASIVFDFSATGVVVNPTRAPLRLGVSTGPKITFASIHTLLSSTLTLQFSGFAPGNSLNFGLGRGFLDATGTFIVPIGGVSGDDLAGATFTAVVLDNGTPHTVTGVLVDKTGSGYRIFDGYGLIDAQNALATIDVETDN